MYAESLNHRKNHHSSDVGKMIVLWLMLAFVHPSNYRCTRPTIYRAYKYTTLSFPSLSLSLLQKHFLFIHPAHFQYKQFNMNPCFFSNLYLSLYIYRYIFIFLFVYWLLFNGSFMDTWAKHQTDQRTPRPRRS